MPGEMLGEFVGQPGSRIFVLLRRPARSSSGSCVLVVPPFAEEMNKSRAMIRQVAERLVERDLGVLVPDLYGTGDSEGEFCDGTVERWVTDLRDACDWSEKCGWRVESLIGVRLGCALAAQAAKLAAIPVVRRSAFWQPVLDGERQLSQFLRLRVAASMMGPGDGETMQTLRNRLAAGDRLEVAGYDISPRLASGMDGLRCEAPPAELGRVSWFEVVRGPSVDPPAAVARMVQRATSSGSDISLHAVAGDPFWASVETVCLPGLVDGTVEALT